MIKSKIGILGAGAFGTSLAICLSGNCEISLFSFFDDHVEVMKRTHLNDFLPGFQIPDYVTIDHAQNVDSRNFDYILWALPVKPSLEILNDIKSKIDGGTIVICSKGLAQNGNFLASEFGARLSRSEIGCLSGPNFATELAAFRCSASDIAFDNIESAVNCSSRLANRYLKLVPCDDMIGIQLCGAAKNVVAIACGIVSGLNLGQNAHSALLSFAISEIRDLGLKLGAKEKTFTGLCGFGDLVLTASSTDSRNTTLGRNVAEGANPESIVGSSSAIYEGYETSRYILALARQNEVSIPICESVYMILHEKKSPESILNVFN
ncbi:MAG: NAD(P)H-dependent glycerol-3-phosphate dehydrogenase [Holosporales bacterium]|jgi:glycerol-3-phosphate dehydrogenase (NAD(P)+)|nr:NAD(P)H-dependent glycerol-3-phosphate dehydrogenase [Holosporales bacterium]